MEGQTKGRFDEGPMTAPWGRRLCEVVESRDSGGYRVFSLLDPEGPEPEPGQFYMLATARHWGEGGRRPFLPRALSVADAAAADPALSPQLASHGDGRRGLNGVRLDFLVEGIGPGTDRLCELAPGEEVWVNGPLGNSFSSPRELSEDAAGAILVGGGIGIAPLALLRRRFAARGVPTQILLGFRDRAHSGGIDDLFSNCQLGLTSDDGHLGERGYVTDLLAAMLTGSDASSAAVYACGPPAMLDAVAALCGERGAACELAMEAPMACGYGACFGCAVPKPGGDGYIRLCVDGPVIRPGFSASAAGPDAASEGPAGGGSTAVLDPSESTPPAEEAQERGGIDKSIEGSGDGALRSKQGEDAVEFCGLKLRSPVINASGTFDAIAARRVYGDAVLEDFPFAAFVSKTITPEPRTGNEPQRIWETPAGMINSIGLPNRGLEGFLAQDLPLLAELPVPLVVSVMATGREDFSRLVSAVAEREEVAAIELNVSCPNVHSGLIVGERPEETEGLLEALRPLTEKPLIVKLTPNVADPAAIAAAAERGGADSVSLINTLKAAAIDPLTGKPGIAAGHGGLSGPAVRPIAIAQLRSVVAAVGLPVIGMGGISTAADAREALDAGAALVAVGTESFRDPRAGSRVASGLQTALSRTRSASPA